MKDDIIRMARQAGGKITAFINYDYGEDVAVFYMEDLHSFADLVRAAERERIIAQNAPEIEKINAHIKTLEKALENEREACAKVCESMRPSERKFDQRFYIACTLNANAIRARGNT